MLEGAWLEADRVFAAQSFMAASNAIAMIGARTGGHGIRVETEGNVQREMVLRL